MKNATKKLLSLTLCLSFCAGFAACEKDNGDEHGEENLPGMVTAEEWKERLRFDYTTAESFTFFMSFSPVEGKPQMEEHESITVKMDLIKRHSWKETTEYEYADNLTPILKRTSGSYSFAYKGKYYHVSYEKENNQYIYDDISYSSDSFDDTLYSIKISALSFFYAYSSLKSGFKYNETTQKYEWLGAGNNTPISFYFSENNDISFSIIHSPSTLEENAYCERFISMSDINSTTVEIPTEVYSLVDSYIAENAD